MMKLKDIVLLNGGRGAFAMRLVSKNYGVIKSSLSAYCIGISGRPHILCR